MVRISTPPRRGAALAALLVAACSDRPQPSSSDAISVADSSGVAVVMNDLGALDDRCAVASEPRLLVGDRQEVEGHQLYRVFGATLLSDGRLAVVDQGSQQLRFYSDDGEFLSASGREGEGPGEFQDAFMLWNLPGDTLWVGDYRPWEFEVFSPDGRWLRQVKPTPLYPNPPRGSGLLADGSMVLAGEDLAERSPDFATDSLHLSLHAPNGDLLDTLAVLANVRRGQTVDDPRSVWLFPWFESAAEFTARGDRFISGHGSRAELRIHDMSSEGRLVRIVRWAGQDLSITPSEVEAAKEALEEQYADIDPGMRASFLEPLVHEDRPVAESLPSFVSVVAGKDDAIWVKRFSRPTAEPSGDWMRFGPDGRFQCHLSLAPEVEVYEFGPDYVVVEQESELGVEMVAVYDFAAPQSRP